MGTHPNRTGVVTSVASCATLLCHAEMQVAAEHYDRDCTAAMIVMTFLVDQQKTGHTMFDKKAEVCVAAEH